VVADARVKPDEFRDAYRSFLVGAIGIDELRAVAIGAHEDRHGVARAVAELLGLHPLPISRYGAFGSRREPVEVGE